MVRFGRRVEARSGKVAFGAVWQAGSGKVCCGELRYEVASCGMAGELGRGAECYGLVSRGVAGEVSPVMFCSGLVWCVGARHVVAGGLRLGQSGIGSLSYVKAGRSRLDEPSCFKVCSAEAGRKGEIMNYEWKKGGYSFKTDAQVAGEVCENLEQTVGLTPQTLLDASRDENAPLHKEFEWNDGIAAENYRRQQARVIIGNLVVKIDEEKNIETRVFFKTTEQKYDSLSVIFKNEDKKEAMLERALKELRAFQFKYKTLSELQPIFDVIDELQTEDETDDDVEM